MQKRKSSCNPCAGVPYLVLMEMYVPDTLNCEKFNHLGVQFKGIHVHMYVIEMYIAKKNKKNAKSAKLYHSLP